MIQLLRKRIDFTGDVALLVAYARHLGFDLVLCEVLRDRKQALWNSTHCRAKISGKRCEKTPAEHGTGHKFKPIGSAKSVHCNGLAVDILIIAGGAIVNARGKYARLGVYWKSLRDGNRWGGDFEGFADLGHFSREHRGRR